MNKKYLPHSLKLCRLCGVYDYLEIDILEESPYTGPNFDDKVFQCCGILIERNDKLTTKLCLQCFEEIKRIDLFRSFCAATNNEIRMEFRSRRTDDSISSDDYDDDVDGIAHQSTASIENDFGIQQKLPPHDAVAPDMGQEDIRERRMCATEENNSSSTASRNSDMFCILLSDDDESEHSDVETVASAGYEGQKRNEMAFGSKKIRRKSTKSDDRNRFTVKCRIERCANLFECVEAKEYHVETFHANKSERELRCHLCKKEQKTRQRLQMHMNELHIGFRPFKCTFPDCSKAFAREHYLRVHTNAVHKQLKPFRCTFPDCSKAFAQKHHLRKHTNAIHKQLKPMKCASPGCSEASASNERQQENEMDNGKKQIKRESTPQALQSRFTVKCHSNSKCSDLFECAEAAEYHLDTFHKKGAKRILSCHLCEKKVSTRQCLQRHMNAVHIGFKPFKCSFPDCLKAFALDFTLRRHTNAIHKHREPFECAFSDRSKASASNDRQERNDMDNGKKKIKRKSTETDERNRFTVKCRFKSCVDSFECVEAMEYHVKTYHANRADRILSCHLCGKKSTTRLHLQRHMNSMHVGLNSFKCSFPDCSKPFTDSPYLHTQAIHTRSRRFECSICCKKFVEKQSLHRHMAYTHGIGIHYCCHLCKKTMYSKSNLRTHFNIKHIGQSSFKCNVVDCSKLFCSRTRLNAHINGVHTQKIEFNCTKCSFITYYETSLKAHLATKHGK